MDLTASRLGETGRAGTSPAWAHRLQRFAFGGLVAALVWAPWPLGSNRAWAVALLALVVCVSVMAAICGKALLSGDAGFSNGWMFASGATLPVACLAACALLLAAQLASTPGDSALPFTLDPFRTRQYLLASLTYLGAWVLTLLTVDSRERATRLLAAVVAAGLLQAGAAVVLYAGDGHYDLFFTRFDQGERAMGTFPSPDNLAGYMELCLGAGLGWLLSQFGGNDAEATGRHWQARMVKVLAFLMSPRMLLRLLLVVMVIALVMTHSRMGNAAFAVSLALTGAMVAMMSKALRRPALWLVASMVLVDVVIIGQWVGLDRVVQRLSRTAESSSAAVAGFGLSDAAPPREESIAERLEIPRQALGLIADKPWFGHGGGTFANAFTRFKQARQSGNPLHWDYAHNDYVQIAADIGWVGLGLLLSVALATFWRALRLIQNDQSRANRGLAIAAVMSLCCMGIHSMVDFNLQIPATALTLTVLLAAVWAVPTSEKRRRRSKTSRG